MKWRKQPNTQTLNFVQEDGYQNTRNKIGILEGKYKENEVQEQGY